MSRAAKEQTVLLVGNPNVGKSALFSHLTGVRIISSNYPGTTVGFTRGRLTAGDTHAEIIDVPGVYSLRASSKAEEVALELLKQGDVIINVVDATNLERNLHLTLQLIKLHRPMLIALNFSDDANRQGISIDSEALEKLLGVPVVPTCGLTKQGIADLVSRLPEARPSTYSYDPKNRWQEIGRIVERVQRLAHRHRSLMEALEDATVIPWSGLPLALLALSLTFVVIRWIGEGLITYVMDPLFEGWWLPVAEQLSEFLGREGLLHDILVGTLIDGEIDFTQSFGVLTSGLYVPLAMVLPYILGFYLVLGVLEDSGYLPRLAVLADRLMHTVGLHGFSVISMLLGLGCNVPGALALRVMESRREKFISATLLAICVPCMSQLAMVVGLLGGYGTGALMRVFGILIVLWFALGYILHQMAGGESPEIFVEIPPFRIPYYRALAQKLWTRIYWFLREAVPYVVAGVLLVNLLYTTGIVVWAAHWTRPFITTVFGLPPEAVAALIVGFVRKDVAVGMLAPLGLSVKQLTVASVVLTMYFPCMATFTVLIKELGLRDMLKATAVMLASTLLVGGLLNVVL